MQTNLGEEFKTTIISDNNNDNSWNIHTKIVYNKCSKLIKNRYKKHPIGILNYLLHRLKTEINLYLTCNYINRSSSNSEIPLFECFRD